MVWFSLTLLCLLLVVMTCDKHDGGLGPELPPTQTVKSNFAAVEEEFKKLIFVDANKRYEALSHREQNVSGTVYFVKVSGDGPDGKVYAILRISSTTDDRQPKLDGFVLVSARDKVGYIQSGVGMHHERLQDGVSPELPSTREVKALVSGVHQEIIRLIKHHSQPLEAISYKTQLTTGLVYFIKVMSLREDSLLYFALRIHVLPGGEVVFNGYERMDPYGPLPVVKAGANLVHNKADRRKEHNRRRQPLYERLSRAGAVQPVVVMVMASGIARFVLSN